MTGFFEAAAADAPCAAHGRFWTSRSSGHRIRDARHWWRIPGCRATVHQKPARRKFEWPKERSARGLGLPVAVPKAFGTCLQCRPGGGGPPPGGVLLVGGRGERAGSGREEPEIGVAARRQGSGKQAIAAGRSAGGEDAE